MDKTRRKITIIALAAITWGLIPLFGLAALDFPKETGETTNRVGNDFETAGISRFLDHAKSLWDKNDSAAGRKYQGSAGIDTKPLPGASLERKPDKQSDLVKVRFSPELGSFFLLGTGLLTLAGWGKRKFGK